MKVQTSLRDIYALHRPFAERLEVDVRKAMMAAKGARWHYESRVKTVESFCGKLETGRVGDPNALEDLLACTLVVPNSLEIPAAVEVVASLYTIEYRRPPNDCETSKTPDTFRFDDLRLYCRRENDGSRPDDVLDGIVFEVQVKTFLQHAWSIATHDLSYKTDDVRWAKDRIVAHLKAAIEHAELSIQEAEALSKSPMLQLSNARTKAVVEVINAFRAAWNREDLPTNLRGLAETITDIVSGAQLTTAQFGELLQGEKARLGGEMPLNLSPYGTAIQLLIRHHQAAVERMLGRAKTKLLLTPELDLPEGFPPARLRNKVVQVG